MQLRMGLGFLIVLSDLLFFLFSGWVLLYWLDHIGWIVSIDCIGRIGWIGLDGLDGLDWIVSAG